MAETEIDPTDRYLDEIRGLSAQAESLGVPSRLIRRCVTDGIATARAVKAKPCDGSCHEEDRDCEACGSLLLGKMCSECVQCL